MTYIQLSERTMSALAAMRSRRYTATHNEVLAQVRADRLDRRRRVIESSADIDDPLDQPVTETEFMFLRNPHLADQVNESLALPAESYVPRRRREE